MASVNIVVLLGNVGQKPESKVSPNGTVMAKFSLATNEKIKKGDVWEEKADWHNVVAFGKTAEYANKYIEKGNRVHIEGKLSVNQWTDDNGNKRVSVDVIAHRLVNLDYNAVVEETEVV